MRAWALGGGAGLSAGAGPRPSTGSRPPGQGWARKSTRARALQGLRPPGAPNTRGTAHGASPGRTSRGRVQPRPAGGRAGKGPFGKGWRRRPSRSLRVAPRLTGAHPAQGSPFPPMWAGLSSCSREARGGTPDSGGEARGGRARRGPVSATRPPPQRPTRGLPLWGPRPGQHGTRCRPRRRRPQPRGPVLTLASWQRAPCCRDARAGLRARSGRAGEGGGPQGRAAGSGTRRLRRGAAGSRQTPPRAQVSSRPAHFKRANQSPPAGKRAGPQRK